MGPWTFIQPRFAKQLGYQASRSHSYKNLLLLSVMINFCNFLHSSHWSVESHMRPLQWVWLRSTNKKQSSCSWTPSPIYNSYDVTNQTHRWNNVHFIMTITEMFIILLCNIASQFYFQYMYRAIIIKFLAIMTLYNCSGPDHRIPVLRMRNM